MDNPPCLKVTHKTFGTQNSNSDMVYCRLSMPVEFHSAEAFLDESLKLRSGVRSAWGGMQGGDSRNVTLIITWSESADTRSAWDIDAKRLMCFQRTF